MKFNFHSRFKKFLAAGILCAGFLSQAAETRPNIVLILADDLGYSDIGCFGSEISTPNIDRLAQTGVRLTQFYNQARCCPTRAALLTGKYPHQVGIGDLIDEYAAPARNAANSPAYQDHLSTNAPTMAERLRAAGYHTMMCGKWHLGKRPEEWPVHRGFDRSFVQIDGAMNYYGGDSKDGARTRMALDDQTFVPPLDGFYSTDSFTDHAIEFLEQAHGTNAQPFFLYLPFNASHWPLQAPEDEIEKYHGKYDAGWQAIRETRLKKMISLGIVPTNQVMSPMDRGNAKAWNELPDDRKRDWERRMEVYAAQTEHLDRSIGRVLDEIKKLGAEENTIVIFLSDNGGAAEDPNGGDKSAPIGSRDSFRGYARPWASVSNTPWRRHKVTAYEGGVSTPFVVHWPAGILKSNEGKLVREPAHVIDLLPTFLNLAGVKSESDKLEGQNILPMLQGNAGNANRTFCWEHEGFRAIRDGKWKLVQTAAADSSWELFDEVADRTESNDLAAAQPEIVSNLKAEYDRWAARCGVVDHAKLKSSAAASKEKTSFSMSDHSIVFKKFLLVTVAMFGFAAFAAKPPNIMVFISDDHTLGDSSVYGSKDMATPHMDKLAAAGLTFDRAFAPSPSCAPSRGAMLTGLMPARNGAEPNHSEPRAEIKKLPAYLQELGYEVVAFGKVGHYNQTQHYGFDLSEHNNYHEDIAIPAALEWLRNRKSDKPLAIFIGSNWPHVPWPQTPEGHKPEELTVPENHVETPATRRFRGKYYAAIGRMDADLGMVYTAAQDKFGTNFFFLHFADQGAQWPFGKWCLYDDGIRTPMIAVWPGHIAPNTRTPAMVSLVDVLPTLVDVAGGKAPENLDGHSMNKILLGQTNHFRDYIFSTHSGDGKMNVYPSRCVRDEKWKYILNLHPEFRFTSHVTEVAGEDGNYWRSWVNKAANNADAADKVHRYQERPREELYDLEKDPWEKNNVAGDAANGEVLKKMRGLVEGWMKEQGDQQKVYGPPTLLSDPSSNKSAAPSDADKD